MRSIGRIPFLKPAGDVLQKRIACIFFPDPDVHIPIIAGDVLQKRLSCPPPPFR